ncbi:MAG: ABC transporter ATP-binding protein [Lachnoclostridium sp.]|nr:ABC transporter ATP-binding protein [Lachnospira sp.]MCM1247897.1 ABC transporter ATP-binding protein [Lachnoclostridium sp.]
MLEDISLTAAEGSCTCILGENGCGKSTLLSILAGVQKADAGKFFYGEEDLFKNGGLRAKVLGYVPQKDPLIEELTAWDNLRMWYDKDKLNRELSDGVLAMLGIDHFLKTPVHKMSGGMKKRLSIGCAVAGQPEILLLDEPSAALDLICKERIYNYFERYKAEGGILLLATHDIRELELCDQCYILKQGSLVSYEYDGNIHHLAGKL